MFFQWSPVLGLVLTASGILAAFYMPTIGARWADEETERMERNLRVRFAIGTVLVLAGTALQIYGAWPRS